MSRSVATLWIGPKLSPLEQLSALSLLETGHELTLYTYEDVQHVPDGVRVADARTLLPGPIVRHKKTGSPALHSDLFRFELMRQTDATWVDLDVLALKPLPTELDYVFGWENESSLNGAILKLPKTSRALQALLAYRDNYKGYPPYLSLSKKLKYQIKTLWRGMTLPELPWGAIGPIGLTYYLGQSGEIQHALPRNHFYPVAHEDTLELLTNPKLDRQFFGPDVHAVHFWASKMRKLTQSHFAGVIPATSFIGREILHMEEKFNVDIGLVLP
jgi:hypothetical protein